MGRPATASAPEPARKWLATLAILSGMFMVGLSVTVMNVAIPSIVTGLSSNLDTVQWVQTAYLSPSGLTGTGVIPLYLYHVMGVGENAQRVRS